jgi:hypothetical protein
MFFSLHSTRGQLYGVRLRWSRFFRYLFALLVALECNTGVQLDGFVQATNRFRFDFQTLGTLPVRVDTL